MRIDTEETAKLKRHGRLHWYHWLVVIGSLILTLSAWHITKTQIEERNSRRFERAAAQLVELVKERMQKYEDALWAGVAAIHSQSHGIDYLEWKRFADTLQLEKKYPGINGIGVIYYVPPEKLDAYLEEQRALRPDYKIHPPHTQNEYWPITYIEPVDTNAKAVGLDMAHETNRWTAAKKARDTGTAQITGPITLVQDAKKTPGFLFYAPFYAKSQLDSIAERQQHYIGNVYAPFIMRKLMDGVLEQDKRMVNVRILDGTNILHDEQQPEKKDYDAAPLFSKTIAMQMYGRPWEFRIYSAASFRALTKNNQPTMILVGGLLIDVMLLALFLVLARSNKKALTLAEKMSDSATSLQEAMENAVEGVSHLDQNGHYRYVNEAYARMTGYAPEELVGKAWPITVYKEDHGRMEGAFQTMLRKGKVTAEARGVRKDGTTFYKQVTMIIRYDEKGKHVGHHCFMQDISQRKESEELVRKSETKFRYAFEGSPIGMALVSPEGQFLQVNKVLTQILGYSKDELLAIDFQSITHPDDLSADLIYLNAMLDKKRTSYQMEKRYFHKDGQVVWALLSVSLVWNEDETPKYFISQVQDITERKAIEAKLKETRAFQKMIMDNIPDLLFVKDQQFRIVEANPAFMKLYPKHMQDKVIGYTTFESYEESQREKFVAEDRRAFEQGYSGVVETLHFPDGNTRTLYTKKIRFENDVGEPFILGLGRDISELMESEKAKEELIEKLTQSNTELERFAYVASHDMQEPLRMVTSFSKILKDEYGAKLDKQAEEYLDMVVESGMRMQEMIIDLLDYSRISHDQQSFQLVDAAAELSHVLSNLKAYIKESGADITHDTLPKFYGNPIQFMRLLQNLITNGIKYQPSGNKPNIGITVQDEDTHWHFTVRDNGLGIDEKYAEQIFTPFRRLHSWEQVSGTGLGLAICKKIVENHNGRIWVVSTPQEGSAFHFTITKGGAVDE